LVIEPFDWADPALSCRSPGEWHSAALVSFWPILSVSPERLKRIKMDFQFKLTPSM
jgi:hypothetical protein